MVIKNIKALHMIISIKEIIPDGQICALFMVQREKKSDETQNISKQETGI